MNQRFFNSIKVVLIVTAVLIIIKWDVSFNKDDFSSILGQVITINGVLIAVITTFLYSKILLERSERIDLKCRIDEIGLKINSLRRIAVNIHHSSGLWLRNPRLINSLYPQLNVFTLREFNYDQYTEFIESCETTELTGQAYLAIEYLIGEEGTQLIINPNYRKNYDLKTIAEYIECCSFFYSYTEEYHDRIRFDEWSKERILTDVRNIDPAVKPNPKELGIMFSNFSTRELENVYGLISKSKRSIGGTYQWIFFDMVISFAILSVSTLCFVYKGFDNYLINFSVIGSVFVVLDLVINTWRSLNREIIVDEFYR